MFGLGPTELGILLLLAFLLFGAKKLPELARSSGEALKEFKKATKEAMNDDDQPAKQPVAQDAPRRMEAPASDSSTTSTSA